MQFNSGIVGVLVVVFALIASVILGVVTNVDSQTVNKDVEEYVADITGGFTADKEQSYTDYNPSGNYNGYTNNTYSNRFAVNFEQSGFVNNYPLSFRTDQTTSSRFTKPSDFQSTTTSYEGPYAGATGLIGDSYEFSESGPAGTLFYENYLLSASAAFSNHSGISFNLSDVFTECVADGTTLLGATPTTVEIDITNTISRTDANYLHVHSPATPSIPTYNFKNNILILPNDPITASGLPTYYSKDKLQTLGADSRYDTIIYYSPSDNAFTLQIGGVPVLTGNPNNYRLIYGTPYLGKITYVEYHQNTPPTEIHSEYTPMTHDSPTLSIKYSTDTITGYIDTRYGIGIRDSESVDWTNKQQNGITSIVFSVWNDSDKTFTEFGNYSNTGIISYYGTTATDTFTISRNSGRTSVSLNGGIAVDLGIWNQIQLDFNNINGTLTAYPISTWDNFNNYTIMDTAVYIGELTKSNLDSIRWSANNSFRLEIENTRVFFNSYGVVMIDPHITITDLWTNYNKFMVALDNVATIGNSITIGTSTYPITNNTITVNDESLDVTKLQMYYSKDDDLWNIKLVSDGIDTEITESSTYLYLSGTWYFNAGFYKITTKQVTENVWNPVYDWFAGNLFFWMAGFTLVGGIISWKLGYADPLSILILIASEVILIIIGGAI